MPNDPEIDRYTADLVPRKGQDPTAPFAGLTTSAEAVSISYTALYVSDPAWFETPWFKAELPCGEVVIYQTMADIPRVNTPCPCGDPTHWVVRVTPLER